MQIFKDSLNDYLNSIIDGDYGAAEVMCAQGIRDYGSMRILDVIEKTLIKRGYDPYNLEEVPIDENFYEFWDATLFIPIINSWANNFYYRTMDEVVNTFESADINFDLLKLTK